MKPTIYIAGPMRGYPKFNFPAFMDAEQFLSFDWLPINPARKDLENGFDPNKDEVTQEMMLKFIRQDVDIIVNQAEAVCVLPGWEKSKGATAEVALAKWKGIPVYRYPNMVELNDEDVLEEALRITRGDRQNQYGPPDQDFQRTAAMWTALFKHNLKDGAAFGSKDVAMFMVLLKCSRQTHQDKRDNWVDIAGYARCGSLCK
jgi:hypothetical protein